MIPESVEGQPAVLNKENSQFNNMIASIGA
jgi:hypothetical protein